MNRTVSLARFVEALCALPGEEPDDPDVIDVCDRFRVDRGELFRYVVWADDHYTRHLVYRDERYQIILLGWGVGQATPVHDHAGQRCWMLVERGRLQIDDYRWKPDGGAPRLLNHEIVGGGDGQLHVDRCGAIHRIANPGEWRQPAVSLHIYSRPFDRCGVYCCETGRRDLIDLHFDSIGPLARAH